MPAAASRSHAVLFLLFSLFLSCCAPLPDVSPFLHATNAAADAVRASGRAAADAAPAHADRLRAAWHARDLAMDAACAYAHDLRHAAERGTSPSALADSLTSLAAAVGITPGPAGAAGRLAAYILTQIDRVRAARTLAEAVERAAPIIDTLAGQLALDADDLRRLVAAAEQDARLTWLEHPERQSAASFLASVHARRDALLSLEFSSLTPAQRDELLELARLAQAAADPDTDRQLERLADAAARARALIDASQNAVLAWSAAHRDLAEALAQSRPIDTAQLTAAILELRRLQSPRTPETQP